jgi:hypothetical protein
VFSNEEVPMPKLRIEEWELLDALSNGNAEISGYLDVQTGAVVSLFMDVDDEEGLEAAVEEDPSRYRYIDPVPSYESYGWMERFADGVQDAGVREHLLDALDRPRPFRRFKDALLEYPEVREAWFRFEREQLRSAAEEWLRQEGVEAELVRRDPVESA